MRGRPQHCQRPLVSFSGKMRLVFGEPRVLGIGWASVTPPGKCWGLRATGASTGRILQKDEGLNVLLNIPDSAKVVAFKPEHPGLWSIKVGGTGFPGCGEPKPHGVETPSPSYLAWGAWDPGKLRAGAWVVMWAYQ